jgi:hypothetical protein
MVVRFYVSVSGGRAVPVPTGLTIKLSSFDSDSSELGSTFITIHNGVLYSSPLSP